jgi:hypothetical protein
MPTAPEVGLYVIAPSHLVGARVEAVRFDNEGTRHLMTWFVLDREHPDGGRIAVGAEDVDLSPVAPAMLRHDAQAWA